MDTHLHIHEQKAIALKYARDEERSIYPIGKSDLLEIDACPLCGAPERDIISEVYLDKKLDFFQTSSCTKCLFTYRSIYPSLDWFKKCWTQLDEKIYKKKIKIFNPEGEQLRKERYEEYLGFLEKFGKGTLLDIGAAYGTGANVFKQSGYDVEAIEPEISKRNRIEQELQIPVVGSSIEEVLSNPPKRYDTVIFSQCLEHIDHPEFSIRNLGKLLKPGGIAYIEIPILWNYVNWSDALYLPHKSNFTEENIVDLVHQGGFEVVNTFWLYKHSKDIPHDFGLILRYTGKKLDAMTVPTHTLADVHSAYRKDIPLSKPPEGILRYTIGEIEHAAQIVITEGKTMGMKDGFIVFE